jgi:hypothetical protein
MKTETILKLTVTFLTIQALAYSAIPRAFSQPQPGCVFYGYVTVGGNQAPDGLNITAAIVNGGPSWHTLTKNGTYGWQTKGSYEFVIPSDNPDTSEKDGAVTGDTIEFYVNQTKAYETATFVSAGARQVDLSIAGKTPEPPTQPFFVTPVEVAIISAVIGISLTAIYMGIVRPRKSSKTRRRKKPLSE